MITRTFYELVGALVGLSLAGCVSSMINAELRRNVEGVNAKAPTIEVLEPKQLATVRHIAVIPFQNNAWGTNEPRRPF